MSEIKNGTGSGGNKDVATDGPGIAVLTATGSGTAMASVCAIGVVEIGEMAGGIWSLAAILIAGLLCYVLSQKFARMSDVIPSGAGLMAYISRGLGRSMGLFTIIPYLLLMLFLVGFEAVIVAELVAYNNSLNVFAVAIAFLVFTWFICQSGIRIGYGAQALATAALFVCLVGLSLFIVFQANLRGDLEKYLFTPSPSVESFVGAVGQALFLFMGFELLTSHVETASPRNVHRALSLSTVFLTIFYGILSLGLACLVLAPDAINTSGKFIVPQLAIANQAGGQGIIILTIIVCALASFTSFNGALLAMSRFTYVLSFQGLLPKRLGSLDPGTRVPRAALFFLLLVSILFTFIVYFFSLYKAAIFAAATAAALMYAVSILTRERDPFREESRTLKHAALSMILVVTFVILAIGVVLDTTAARTQTIALLGTAYITAAIAAVHIYSKNKSLKIKFRSK